MRFALTHGFLVLDEWTTLADGTLIIEDGKIDKALPTSEFHPENMAQRFGDFVNLFRWLVDNCQ